MQLKLLLGQLGRKNLITHAGFWPELKVIRKSVKDQNKLISLLLHYLDLLLNGKLFPCSHIGVFKKIISPPVKNVVSS